MTEYFGVDVESLAPDCMVPIDHPPVTAIWVLAKQGAERATLFTASGGENTFRSLTRKQLLTLIETAAMSLKAMESDSDT